MDTVRESEKVTGPPKKDLTFHSFDVTPESAHTALLLLISKEPEILSKTLRAITKFGAQDLQNCQVLFDLNGIDYYLPLIEHSEQNIKRFALKALSQLCQMPDAIDRVLANPQNLKKVTYMIAKAEDILVLEFASLLLSKLTTKQLGCQQLIEANVLGSLFSRMKNCLDPDVQKNCLQTLSNLLSIPACASEVTKNQQFSWPSLLVLTKSKFLAIQSAALTTVDQLISRYFDTVVQKSFKASTGVLDHCDILESYEFRDMHIKVLGNLRNYVETEDNAAHFYQAGCVERLLNYLDTTLPPMKPYCLAVLTKMSFTNNGRDALYNTGTDLVFAAQLLSSNVELLADAAMGVANMTKLLPAAVRMSDTNIIEALCGILNDDAAAWFYIRMNSLRALADLCRIIPKAAYSLVEPKTFSALRYININYRENPIEAQRLAVQCYINLQNYHVSTHAMHNMEFTQELVDIMTRTDITLKILTSKALTGLMSEEIAKDLFTACKGEERPQSSALPDESVRRLSEAKPSISTSPAIAIAAEVISTNLRIEHIGLRTALCGVIAASVSDEGADVYLELGTIHYMVENRSARYMVSAWEPALEAIFRHHPSAKLAYTGRLDVDDFTREGFYVQKRLGDSFPTIQEILSCPPPHRHRDPVFICRFYQPSAEVASGLDIRTPYRQSESRLAMASMSRFRLPLPDDTSLRSYLLKMRVWFGEPSKSLHYFEIEDAHFEVRYREKCAEVPLSLKQRAQLLAEFVAEQMSGFDHNRDCAMPSVNLHLMDLMHDLESRVLGLGWVRCGGALERAVLYKVLADRVGLPCALHRRAGARAWCEVALPAPDPADPLDKEANFPAGLLRPNFVVDLMFRPGRLLPIGSHEARRICGPPGAPRYTSRKLPEGCRCEPSTVHSNSRTSNTSIQR